jgi:autotransporter-associated beta strand protein
MSTRTWKRWIHKVLAGRGMPQRRFDRRRPLQLEMLEERVTPATFIWTGGGTNNLWSNPSNWQGGVAPTSAANPDLVFPSGAARLNNTNDLSGLVVRSITVSGSNYTLGGNAIQLAGNVVVASGVSNVRITLNANFTTTVSVTVNNLADLTISGQISGGSGAVLTKLGTGTLTLGGNNSAYSAPIDIQNGRLVITHVNALGTTSAETIVNPNAQLQIRNIAGVIGEPLRLNGFGISSDGALFNAAGNSIWGGTITLDSDSSIGVASGTSLDITGLITDTGAGRNLTKVGSGQLIFSRTGGNTYRGTTTINDGILTIRDPQSLGAGSIFGAPQNGTPQARTIVNYNPVSGQAGTLQIEFAPTVLAVGDPNGILRDPTQPYHPVNNPYVGFQVFNDILELNGPGFNNLGALHNKSGRNIWNGPVRLGSPLPNTSDITIGVDSNSELTISGVVSDDPGRTGSAIPDLIKTLPGRLILDNVNTYRGNTEIRDGVITMRDSQALGPASGGTVTVFNGAALELEVDSGLDGTPLRSHGRNLGFDSETYNGPGQEVVVNGTSGTFTLTFNGASTAPLPVGASAAMVQAALNSLSTVSGAGGSFTVTQNANVYRIFYGGTFNDPLNPIPLPLLTVTTTGAATAFVNPIYGLIGRKQLFLNGRGVNNTGALRSISGLNQWVSNITLENLTPVGSIGVDADTRPGHPTADRSYLQYDYSLTLTSNDNLDAAASVSFVKLGAGHLQLPTRQRQLRGPTSIEQGWITIGNDESLGPRIVDITRGETAQPNTVTVLAGAALHLVPGTGNLDLANRRLILSGEGISHPFAMLQQGALLSLGGNNTISGDVFLRGTATAPRVGIGVDDPIMGNPPNASTLTITGSIADYVPPPLRLSFTARGREQEERFLIDTGGTSGTITVDYNFYRIPDQLQIFYPPQENGGTKIYDSGLINGSGTVTVNYGPGTSTFVELVMNPGGQPPGTIWDFQVVIQPNPSPQPTDLIKMGSRLLTLQGDGTYSGNVEVRSGTLRVQHDTALGRRGSGTTSTPQTQTYSQTNTTVQPGARLELAPSIAANNGGISAGLQIWDERLVLKEPGQQIAVNGNAGTFTLTFNGHTTAPLPFNASALDIQNALNALPSIGGIGGSVTVTQSGNIFTVIFGGTLQGQLLPLITASTSGAPGNLTVTVSGSSAPLSVLSGDHLWRGPVTLAADTAFDIADNARLTITGRIDDTPNPAPSGSNLSVGLIGSGNTGELVLAGGNTYRGTTYVRQGVLTIAHSQALGGIGASEVQTVTLGGSTSGTFTLSFDGHTTPALPASATAAQVQAALNALPSIGGVGGSVNVTRSGSVLTISFDGVLAGADQPTLVANGAGGTTATVATVRDGYGGTIVSSGAQLQMRGSLNVAGESLILQGTGPGAADAPTAIPLRWFTLGPAPINNGQTPGNNASTGRITGVAVDPSDPNVIYVSTAGGGAWKTKNGGLTWLPLFDNHGTMFSGAIAVAPSNPRVIYFGTGEGNNSFDSYYGSGVYKSTDSGRTWTLLTNLSGANPLQGQAINKIVVDPFNANRIYVATSRLANNGNPSQLAGVWRYDTSQDWINLTTIVSSTRNGSPPTPNTGFPSTPPGTPGPDDDWRITFVNDAWTDLYWGYSVGAFGNLVPALFAAQGNPNSISQSNPYDSTIRTSNAVYRLLNPHLAGTAATTHWFIGDGNPVNASGQHAYSNGGSNPFPTTDLTQAVIKIAGFTPSLVPPSAPSTLYAMIVSTSGQLLAVRKSTDGGRNWNASVNTPPNMLLGLGLTNNAIAVDPANPNIVAIGGTGNPTGINHVYLSTDGGGAWTDISIRSGNGPHGGGHGMAFDRDGQLVYVNNGGVWRYSLSSDRWTNLNGGQQATTLVNSVATHPTNPDLILAGTHQNGLARYTGSQAWQMQTAGNAGRVRFDPSNPNVAYLVRDGQLVRSTDGGQTWPTVLYSAGGVYFSFVVDPLVTGRIVVGHNGVNGVQESLDGGATWNGLSAPIGFIQDVAVAQYQGNFQFDPAFPLVTDRGADVYDPDTIYVAGPNTLWVTKNHGLTWVNRTAGLPVAGSRFIQSITVDPRDRDTIYVVLQNRIGGGNFIYRSTDAGQNWTDITGTLPDVPLWRLVVDPRDGTLYVGTDDGVWFLPGGSGTWQRFGNGLPRVQVTDLDLNMNLNTLTVSTYGRGVYQFYLDDVLADSGALRVQSGSSVWSGPIRLAGPTTISVGGPAVPGRGASLPRLDIVGVVSDATSGGNYQLTKTGTGDLVLSAPNTYGGVTDIQAGTLTVNHPQALGSPSAQTIVRSGAALQLKSDLEGEPVQLNGHGTPGGFNGHNTGALRNISGSNTYTGPLTLASDATIGVESGTELTIGTKTGLSGTGTLNGTANLTKELTGTLTLASDNGATFTGNIAVYQGVLRLEHSRAAGNGGTVRIYDGAQLQLRTPTAGPHAGTPVQAANPLFLSGTGIFGTGALQNIAGNNAWLGPITFDVLANFSPTTTPAGIVSINVLNANDVLTLSGSIAETAPTGLTKIGPGTLSLTNASTYSGATEVQQGTLNVQHANALGSRSGLTSIQRIVTISPSQSGSFRLTFNGHTTASISYGASAADVQTALEGLPSIGAGQIASVTRIDIPTMTQTGPGPIGTGYLYTVVFGGTLANTTLSLTAQGFGDTLASASVVATGGVDVRVANGATLELEHSSGLTISGHHLTLVGGSGVSGQGALRNISGINTWNGPVRLLANAAVGVDSASALTLSGGVSATTLTLTKLGSGTLIFPASTPANTQALTRIVGGTVQVNGTIGDVRLAGGTISGTGTVGQITSDTPAPGSMVSPGNTFPTEQIGTLTSSGATLHSSNTVFVHLSNPGSPTSDLLNLTGNIQLGGASLAGTVDANVGLGDRFTIVQTTGTVSGQFAGASTTPTMAGASSATIAYVGGQKFVANYFSDRVVLERVLSTVTMNLTPSVSNPVYGQPVVFNATLTPEDPNLAVSGNVVFTVIDPTNATFTFTIPINPSTKTATFDPAAAWPNGFGGPLELGTYQISASYNGIDQNGQPAYPPVSTGPLTVNVTAAPTTTNLTSSHPSGAPFGVAITFTATVTSAVTTPVTGTLPPDGTVSFYDGATLLGTANLTPSGGVSATATFTISTLSVGTHNIIAVYNSDGFPDRYDGSSGSFTQLVGQAGTTTVLTSAPNPSNYGQSVTLTATVSSTTSGTPTGTVVFRLGPTVLGTATLNGSGVATYTTTAFQLPGGTLTLTADYQGDSTFAPSSGSTNHTVNSASSTTQLISSPNPSVYGQPVTFTATVIPGIVGGATPTGTVTFRLGATILGTATLSGGVATFTTSVGQLPVGTNVVTADYAGDGTYDPSSANVTQVVSEAGTETELVVRPGEAVAWQAVRLEARVRAVSPGAGVPTGSVVFRDVTTGRVLGTAAVGGGGVAVLWTHLGGPLGVHRVRAEYMGDGNYGASRSGLVGVEVVANGTRASSVVVRSSPNPSNVGVPVVLAAVVRDGVDGTVTPSGTVAFYANGVLLGYGVVRRVRTGVGRAELVVDSLAVGVHDIVARYSGSRVYARAVSGVVQQEVRPPATRASTVVLQVSPGRPTVYGEPVQLLARVSDLGGGAPVTPSGVVRFYSDGVEVGRGVLVGVGAGVSEAVVSVTSLGVGEHDLEAEYLGDVEFAGGVWSGVVVHEVEAVGSTVVVGGVANPSRYGGEVELRAEVRAVSPSVGVATGQVVFRDVTAGVVLGSAVLDGFGVAVLRVRGLGVGLHRIEAEYLGDGNVLGSVGGYDQVVLRSQTGVELSRSTALAGRRLVVRARVVALPPGGGVPGGVARLYVDGVLVGGVSLDGDGVARWVLPGGVSLGRHVFRVVYDGDGNYLGSTATQTWDFVIGRNT